MSNRAPYSRGTSSNRSLWEVVEVTQDCELGKAGERAAVVELDEKYMTLVFTGRPQGQQKVSTGADYRFLRTAKDRAAAPRDERFVALCENLMACYPEDQLAHKAAKNALEAK